MKAKLILNGINGKVELYEEVHKYQCSLKNGILIHSDNQLSITKIISQFQVYSFEPANFGMYGAIIKKYHPNERDAWRIFKLATDSMATHLEYRSSRGTELHKKAELKQIPYIENLIEELNWDKENVIVARELMFYLKTDLFDLPGTIDIVMINRLTNEVQLVDFKFSNGNKRDYLDKQLNLYMAILKLANFKCRGLIGLTIKDDETITLSKIENKDYDLKSIMTTINYFRKE